MAEIYNAALINQLTRTNANHFENAIQAQTSNSQHHINNNSSFGKMLLNQTQAINKSSTLMQSETLSTLKRASNTHDNKININENNQNGINLADKIMIQEFQKLLMYLLLSQASESSDITSGEYEVISQERHLQEQLQVQIIKGLK